MCEEGYLDVLQSPFISTVGLQSLQKRSQSMKKPILGGWLADLGCLGVLCVCICLFVFCLFFFFLVFFWFGLVWGLFGWLGFFCFVLFLGWFFFFFGGGGGGATWSCAVTAQKFDEIAPVGKALGVSLPSVCCVKTPSPPFFTAPSWGLPVKTWVH